MITLSNIEKNYEGFTLNIPDLTISSGINVLIGQNGAGKTTLVKCMLGLREYDGRLEFNGKTMKQNRCEILNQIGYVGDSFSMYENARIKDIVHLLRDSYKNWDADLFTQTSENIRLKLNGDMKFGALSKGTKIKFSFATAIAHKPNVYIFDEPTSNLDPLTRQEVLGIIKSLRDSVVLFTTHIIEDALEIGQRLLILNSGCLVFSSEISRIPSSDAKQYILSMLGKDDEP